MTPSILIAEDDSFLATMMEKIFQKKNVRVRVAYNGEEAIESIQKEVPDVLLLDILMPIIDGLGVIKFLKKKKLDCPVIVVTNVSDTKTKNTCKKMNVKHYFVKNDMDDDALWPTVEQYLH